MILDSSAIVAVVFQESGHGELVDKIAAADEVAIGAPTLAEAAIVVSARLGTDARPLLSRLLTEGAIETIPFGEAHFGVAVGAWLYFGGDLGASAAGLVAAVVALAANVASTLLGRGVNRSEQLPAVTVTTVSMAIGAGVLVFIGIGAEGIPEITLRGWLIKGRADRVVIQSHFGVQCSRSGYTPKGKGLIKMWKKDISFLRQARYLSERGYTVLMYDFRNHGESGRGTCPWICWGPEEAKDVVAAVDFITHHRRHADAGIGLLSVCMGAVASTYAYGMGDEGLKAYPNIKAKIAVQPLHYKEFVKAFGIPGFLNKAGSKVSLERTGIDLNTKTFMPDVKHIAVPTMVVQNNNDPWTDMDFVRKYFDELTVEKEILWLDLSKKRAAGYDYLGTNPEQFAEYFGRYL